MTEPIDISTLLEDYSWLNSRVKHLSFDTSECGERVEIRASYLTFRDGIPTFDEFIDAVSLLIIPFCLPRRLIIEANEKVNGSTAHQKSIAFERLSQKARDMFMKARKGSSRSGEGGEIVLYLLNEWILKAPQIASKMYLKTNNNMPVHGADGIHARFDEGTQKLIIYWGESKAHSTINSALTSALDSIEEFLEGAKEKHEIEIVKDHYDLGEMSDESVQAMMRFFDPYEEASNERVPVFSCLLMFNHDFEDGGSKDEQAHVNDIEAATQKFVSSIAKKLESRKLSARRFEFFLMPIPDVQNFRDKFQSKIGWPE